MSNVGVQTPSAPPPGAWNQRPPAPPPPSAHNKLSPGVLAGIVVAGLLAAGGVGAVIGGSRDAAATPHVVPTVPNPPVVTVPVSSATTVPGPLPTAVSTAPGSPVPTLIIRPGGSTATAPQPAPTVAPVPTVAQPPATVGRTPVTLGQTPTPSPVTRASTAPQPNTTAPNNTPSGSNGRAAGAVTIGAGVSIVPPSGWKVSNQQNGDIFLTGPGGEVEVALAQAGNADASTVVTNLQKNYLPKWLQSPQMSAPTAQQPPSSDVITFATADFAGELSGNQGSFAVEGIVIAAVRQDGLAFSLVAVWPQGGFDSIQNDLGSMLGSVLKTF